MNIGDLRRKAAGALGKKSLGEVHLDHVEVFRIEQNRRGKTLQVAEVAEDGSATTLRVYVRDELCRRLDIRPGSVCTIRGEATLFGETMELSIVAHWVIWHPAAGAGPLRSARRLSERRLEDKGYFDPTTAALKRERFQNATRFLVLAPENGAGRDDFQRGIQGAKELTFIHQHVVTEGPNAVASLVEKITNARDVDAIVIVRGGGNRFALRAFDDESVVCAIAASPLPVALGIGHARDNDLLAARAAALSWATPTLAARQIVSIAHKKRDATQRANREKEADRQKREILRLRASEKASAALWTMTRHQIQSHARGRVRLRATLLAMLAWCLSSCCAVAVLTMGLGRRAALITLIIGILAGFFLWSGRRRADKPLPARRHTPLPPDKWVSTGLQAKNPRGYRLLTPPAPERPTRK